MYLNSDEVIKTITLAIESRIILLVKYQHVEDKEIVVHRLAPFDIGSTNPNPKVRDRSVDRLYAYSFTHFDEKSNFLDPKVCSFNIKYFLSIVLTDQLFDETELALLNLQRTKYDYRTCDFALLPMRHWFK